MGNTFLYWEEEIKVIEGMKNEGLVTGVNKNGLTHKWAEATSKSRQAKEQLERMCRELSDELSEFDFRKEQEIKHIFIEFSENSMKMCLISCSFLKSNSDSSSDNSLHIRSSCSFACRDFDVASAHLCVSPFLLTPVTRPSFFIPSITLISSSQ